MYVNKAFDNTDLALAEDAARSYTDDDFAAPLLAEHNDVKLTLQVPGGATTVETRKARIRPKLGESDQFISDFGQTSPEFDRCLPRFGQHWAELEPIPATSGPGSTKSGRHCRSFAQNRSLARRAPPFDLF